MAAGLETAADALRPGGDVLVFWDCYRPHDVQVRMYEAVSDSGWVSRPGAYARSHEAGLSVDVTLERDGALVDMGTGFDEFTPRANAYATDGVSPTAQANRARLRDAMAAGGLTVYKGEWWHFDAPGAVRQPPDSRCGCELGDLIPRCAALSTAGCSADAQHAYYRDSVVAGAVPSTFPAQRAVTHCDETSISFAD